MIYSRRQVLFSGASLAVMLASCSTSTVETHRPLPAHGPLVDAHCHIFNASDLSIRGFVRRVVLDDYEDEVQFPTDSDLQTEGIFEAFASILIDLMSSGAITAGDEADQIRNPSGARGAASPDAFRDRLSLELEQSSLMALEESEEGKSRKVLLDAFMSEAGLSEQAFDTDVVAEQLLESEGFFGRKIRWAKLLTGTRQNLLEELIGRYGGPDGVALLTPAMVDYATWLNDEPTSDLMSQVLVMHELQKRASAPVHGFVAFDPWRHARDAANNADTTALDIVKAAIEDYGFVGVKLYPPMGFLPLGNQGVPNFPERARLELGVDFPKKLDDALRELYAWCVQEGVAVMAHATDSQGANRHYSRRANPEGWKMVLQEFPDLQLNLGHFGHFNDARSTTDLRPWESATGEIINVGFPNVFADLSYLDELLPGKKGRDQVVNGLRDFTQAVAQSPDRLIYGSDWVMIGLEPGNREYHGSLDQALADANYDAAQRAALFRTNALRFLDIRTGSRATERLRHYYDKHDMDVEIVDRLAIL